jgi:tetratricopeptide (TPR) repeat protein
MSKAQYEKWDRLNYEDEEQKVEDNSKVDERDGNIAKLEKQNADTENRVVKEDEDASESLISKSKVEEFRKIKKGRRKRGGMGTERGEKSGDASSASNVVEKSSKDTAKAEGVPSPTTSKQGGFQEEPVAASTPAHTPAPALADEYLAKAEAVKRRADFLKAAREARNQGKELAKSQKFSSAMSTFVGGLQSLDDYEALLEPVTPENPGGAPQEDAPPKKSKSHAVCCGQDAAKIKAQQLLLKPGHLKTTKENLGVTLRRDFNLNIGRCHLELGRPAEAAECFKYVLLVDGGNVNAWVARAECFRRMELYSLAEFHLVKAVEIDDVDRNAKAVKKMNDQDLILKKVRRGGVDKMR